MKKIILTLLCFISTAVYNAQSKSEIANVYIKRANKVINEKIDFKEAKVLFDKAMDHTDTITSSKIAKLGARIHFELEDYKQSILYFKQYFLVEKNKKSDDYMVQVDLFVTTKEELQIQLEKEKKIENERIAKEKELKKIDSLKTVWRNNSNALSLKLDTILPFNKNNLAVFKKGENFGLIDDFGKIVLEANKYKAYQSFDGYVIFSDKQKEPTKVYSYNINTKAGFVLPKPSDLNSLSTNYGQIMLPRANGRLVMYPNNSYKVLVYDLEEKRTITVSNEKELFKTLKKSGAISRSNKEGNVKINKKWYGFAGHLGGGIHPLTNEKQYSLFGFLCAIDGTVLNAITRYNFLGAFYSGSVQAIKDNETTWVNQNGTEVDAAKDESGIYTGDSKLEKLETGAYQIKQNGIIVLGDKKLVKMEDFLRENNPK